MYFEIRLHANDGKLLAFWQSPANAIFEWRYSMMPFTNDNQLLTKFSLSPTCKENPHGEGPKDPDPTKAA